MSSTISLGATVPMTYEIEGGKATVDILRVGPTVQAQWKAAQDRSAFEEKRRLAALRKEFTRDVMPELWERPELDGEGQPIVDVIEEPYLGADGRPVMVSVDLEVNGTTVPIDVQARRPKLGKDGRPVTKPRMLPPLQTPEYAAAQFEQTMQVFRDAVARVVVERAGGTIEIKAKAEIVDVLGDLGLFHAVANDVLRITVPTRRQSF